MQRRMVRTFAQPMIGELRLRDPPAFKGGRSSRGQG